MSPDSPVDAIRDNKLGTWRCPQCRAAIPMRPSEFPIRCSCGYFGTIDENGADVPLWRLSPQPDPAAPSVGPGTELHKLLARLGIKPEPNCKCNQRAREMDRQGPDWCEQHLEEIVGWLKEEAAKKPLLRLTFSEAVARRLVRAAIRRARAAG